MRRALTALAVALGVAVAGTTTAAVAAPAAHTRIADNPYQRGPEPTVQSIEATTGYYATEKLVVERSAVKGFGGGTIYYPTERKDGTFGAIAIAPGYGGKQSSIAWYGPRVASQGFVVFVIDTKSTGDFPPSRGDQLLAALDYLTGSSAVKDRVDAKRVAVSGYSMGGGGTLEAAAKRPSLRAALPLAPWSLTKSYSSVTVPTFIIAGQKDETASPANHALPFYKSLTKAPERAYMELAGAGHSFPASPNTTVAKYYISWSKRFIDDDTRYDKFLCPAPKDAPISQYLDSCPHGS